MAGQRPHIALLVANIIDPFSNSVAKGAMAAANRLGADLTIFPGKYIGLQNLYEVFDTTYEYQYNVLFDLAAAGGFDYIIAAVGTIAYPLDNEGKKRFLEKFGNTPVLSVAADIEGYDSLEFDNRSGILDIIDELAAQGRQHIGIMAGDLKNAECAERYAAFRDALRIHKIPFSDKYFMCSDISERCREEAEELIDRAPELDAVVCANDDIAAVMYKVLKERGKIIGRDVAVTGFDDLPGSSQLDPPLSTVHADAEGLGARAVEKVINRLNGIDDRVKRFPTEFIRRGSSSREYVFEGYKKLEENEKLALRKMMNDRIHVDNIFVRDAMMFGGELKNSYAKILKQLPLVGAMTAFIYTFDKPVLHRYDENFPKDVNLLFRSYSYGSVTYTLPPAERKVTMNEVFRNRYLCAERQHCFIVADLYTAETQYGIALLEPESPDFFSELELVTYILSSAVRTLDILSKQDALLNELHLKNLALENESKIDSLTGIYNRRGFYLAAEELIEQTGSTREYVICYADMDELKSVNDNYGHQEGDRALKLIAEGLKRIFGNNGVIGRFGGDEFAAVCPKPSGTNLDSYLAAKEKYTEEIHRSGSRQYKLDFSLGLTVAPCENSYDLRAALDRADDLLYAEKSKKKKRRMLHR